jgi:hypothetical protein
MRCLYAAALLALAGCASGPEFATPSLSSAQLAELQRRAQPPEALGIGVWRQGGGVMLRGVNELSVTGTVTVPLSHVETSKPFEPGGRFGVPVVVASVNGHDGVRVMLDSGSNQSLCGYGLARSLELIPIAGLGASGAHGIGGSVENHPALASSVRVGGLELRKLVTMIGPDVQALRVQQFWGSSRVFLLGVNLLRGLSYLTVDSLRGVVVFGSGESYRTNTTNRFVTRVPLGWLNNLPCVSLTVDGQGPYSCIVDTGGNYGLLLSRAQATELGYWREGKGKVDPSSGVAGTGLAATYNVGRAVLGGATLRAVPGRTIVIGPEPAGGQMLIGNEVVRRYRVTFDFKHQQFWLEN